MARGLFITHPEVIIDPTRPVPRWSLSEVGRRRMAAFAASPEVGGLTAVWSSEETKAVESGAILAARLGLSLRTRADLHENDRSATGYLAGEAFLAARDAFFARPDASFRGWETARAAQARVVAAVDAILAYHPGGDIAFVAHGAVGTLLLCKFLGQPITGDADQPSPGHLWTFDLDSRQVLEGWRPLAPYEAG